MTLRITIRIALGELRWVRNARFYHDHEAACRKSPETVSNAGQAFSLRMPTLLMMASIVLLAVSAGLGVLGRPLGLFIDKRNRMSLTRMQFAVWLIILVGGLASYALYNVGFWGDNLNWIHAKVIYVTEAGKSDQKLTGWSDQLSARMTAPGGR
jgi:hypothetical protein